MTVLFPSDCTIQALCTIHLSSIMWVFDEALIRLSWSHVVSILWQISVTHLFLSLSLSVWGGWAFLWWAVGKSVSARAEQTSAWSEQRWGGPFETEKTDAEESRLRPVLPLQTTPAPARARVRETYSHTAGTQHTHQTLKYDKTETHTTKVNYDTVALFRNLVSCLPWQH